jgi:hypothetical protein
MQAVSGASAAVFPPTVAAITLGVVGSVAFARRIGRNEAFNHGGNAACNVVVGAGAAFFGPGVVFWLMGAMAGAAAARAAAPGTRVFAVDPVINVVARPHSDAAYARAKNEAQYHPSDMLTGRRDPELGGGPQAIDAVGVNFYWNNQWLHPDAPRPADAEPDGAPSRDPLSVYDPRFRPFRDMLAEVHARYRRPVFVAETSIEGPPRAAWLRYVCEEVRAAITMGVPVEGICLYPVLSHLGWDDDRYCPNGLFELETRQGRRVVHAPLAAELQRQQALFSALFEDGHHRYVEAERAQSLRLASSR